MKPRLRILPFLLGIVLLAPLTAVSLVAGAASPPAQALQAVAHGRGMLWAADHWSWIGNYELDDGRMGYCIDLEKPPPTGASFDYRDGASAGLFAADDAARLAFISRRWGAPGDAVTAAAAQLATWSITGLAGHDLAFYAQRANGDASAVLALATEMLRQIDGRGGASRGASATVDVDLDRDRVETDLLVDHLAGRLAPPPGSHDGTLTLTGATFADGSRSTTVANGSVTAIVPDQTGPTESVSASIVYRDLPYGSSFRLARNTGSSQSLLVQSPFPIEARASDSARAPSGLPLRPLVETRTSAIVAAPGVAVHDTLELKPHPQSALGRSWGVYASASGGLAPIPVVVRSRLLGPFPERPVRSPSVPADAPVVCEFDIEAASGPGTYESPSCTLPAAGFYVWTDSIDPARTPPEKGGGRLEGWSSDFGVATETTLAPATPHIATAASASVLDGPGCVRDRLEVSGLPSEVPMPIAVVSTLHGPLDELPPAGAVPPGWEDFPVAGRTTTLISYDGLHDTACLPVSSPGAYYFTVESPSVPTAPALVADAPAGTALPPLSEADAHAESALAAASVIQGFRDLRVHQEESFQLVPPATPPVPPTTPAPPIPSIEPPAHPSPPAPAATTPAPLAHTGTALSPPTIAVTLAALILGIAAVGLTLGRSPVRGREHTHLRRVRRPD